MFLSLALISLAAIPEEIAVRVHTPTCELSILVPDALSRALEGVRISSDGEPTRAKIRFLLELEALKERAIRVALFDEKNERVLVRALPMRPETCAATADGIAVIVERHLRDLGWIPRVEAEPHVEPEPRVEQPRRDPPPAREPLPEVEAPIGVEPRTPPITREVATTTTSTIVVLIEVPAVPRTSTAASTTPEPAPVAADSTPITVAFDARIDGRRFGPELRVRASFDAWDLSVVAGYSFPESSYPLTRENREGTIGTIELSVAHAQLEGGYCVPLSIVRGCAELGLGLEVFSARSSGELVFGDTSDLVLRPVLLGQLRAELALSEAISFFAFGGLRYRPLESPGVEGTVETVPETWVPQAGLGVSLRAN